MTGGSGYMVEVTGLSPKTTEKDLHHFFAFSGAIEHVEIVRSGDCACTAYVTFKDAYSQETACLLSTQHRDQFVSSAGEAVTAAQEVVKTMLAKGYVLSKDALAKAREFDESHQVSATATAKVSELSERLRLADKISTGVGAVKSVDQKYNISEIARSAASATGRSVAAAGDSVVNSSYFSKGALWLSGALTRAAHVASDLGARGDGQH
ncbi:binding partner of ACD11 1 isoform X2 [Arachis ipaensis]|uniref:binding partner of ACD11 1 isoform X2 n=1 Tax=Arachis ipaensis TaxID=130454 RepID=UPI000A2B9842|nr:binding partner of ACD11 1 isoform X2 [Arachis ipaensis]